LHPVALSVIGSVQLSDTTRPRGYPLFNYCASGYGGIHHRVGAHMSGRPARPHRISAAALLTPVGSPVVVGAGERRLDDLTKPSAMTAPPFGPLP
jgi:hypothetical protein